MAKYLHVTVNCYARPVPEEQLTKLFDTSLDWIKYAPNCWILWTTTSPQDWHPYIRRVLHEDDIFLICELNMENRQGWLPRRIWDWIRKER
jgi:hypothetical protein